MEQETESREQLKKLKESHQNTVEEMRSHKEDGDERVKDMQRKLMQNECEFEKEKALFNQKVEFLEHSLAERQAKEKQQLELFKSRKTEMTGELKTTI